MSRTAAVASPFNCRWIPITLAEPATTASGYAICVRNGPHVVSERECSDCPHWQERAEDRAPRP
jgi:hypothetical protein